MNPCLVLTNAIWLLPAWLAYQSGQELWTVAALVMMFLSVTFHVTNNFWLEFLDTAYALLYVAAGPMLLWWYGVGISGWLLATAVAALAATIYRFSRLHFATNLYVWWHSVWHVAAGLVASTVYTLSFF